MKEKLKALQKCRRKKKSFHYGSCLCCFPSFFSLEKRESGSSVVTGCNLVGWQCLNSIFPNYSPNGRALKEQRDAEEGYQLCLGHFAPQIRAELRYY